MLLFSSPDSIAQSRCKCTGQPLRPEETTWTCRLYQLCPTSRHPAAVECFCQDSREASQDRTVPVSGPLQSRIKIQTSSRNLVPQNDYSRFCLNTWHPGTLWLFWKRTHPNHSELACDKFHLAVFLFFSFLSFLSFFFGGPVGLSSSTCSRDLFGFLEGGLTDSPGSFFSKNCLDLLMPKVSKDPCTWIAEFDSFQLWGGNRTFCSAAVARLALRRKADVHIVWSLKTVILCYPFKGNPIPSPQHESTCLHDLMSFGPPPQHVWRSEVGRTGKVVNYPRIPKERALHRNPNFHPSPSPRSNHHTPCQGGWCAAPESAHTSAGGGVVFIIYDIICKLLFYTMLKCLSSVELRPDRLRCVVVFQVFE